MHCRHFPATLSGDNLRTSGLNIVTRNKILCDESRAGIFSSHHRVTHADKFHGKVLQWRNCTTIQPRNNSILQRVINRSTPSSPPHQSFWKELPRLLIRDMKSSQLQLPCRTQAGTHSSDQSWRMSSCALCKSNIMIHRIYPVPPNLCSAGENPKNALRSHWTELSFFPPLVCTQTQYKRYKPSDYILICARYKLCSRRVVTAPLRLVLRLDFTP